MDSLSSLFKQYQSQVNKALLGILPSLQLEPKKLHEAMHYSVFNGGKRFRPILTYSIARTQNIDLKLLDACACSLELIHSYSLIHDDLPAMDNDDLRRGKPTCHIQFDEATAILTGDALQAFAFDVLLNHLPNTLSSSTKIEIMKVLSDASGSYGMAGGQSIDLESANKKIDLEKLQEMHRKKTGALITASIKMACLNCSMDDETTITKLVKFSELLGLNFQITDDILDIESDTETLGKPQGSDIEANKSTFPSILGLDEAKQYARRTHEEAVQQLSGLPSNYDILRDTSHYILNRNH